MEAMIFVCGQALWVETVDACRRAFVLVIVLWGCH